MEISPEFRKKMILLLIEALKGSPSFCNFRMDQLKDAVLKSEHQTFQQSKSKEEYIFYINEKLKKIRSASGSGSSRFEFRSDKNLQGVYPDEALDWRAPPRYPQHHRGTPPPYRSAYSEGSGTPYHPKANYDSISYSDTQAAPPYHPPYTSGYPRPYPYSRHPPQNTPPPPPYYPNIDAMKFPPPPQYFADPYDSALPQGYPYSYSHNSSSPHIHPYSSQGSSSFSGYHRPSPSSTPNWFSPSSQGRSPDHRDVSPPPPSSPQTPPPTKQRSASSSSLPRSSIKDNVQSSSSKKHTTNTPSEEELFNTLSREFFSSRKEEQSRPSDFLDSFYSSTPKQPSPKSETIPEDLKVFLHENGLALKRIKPDHDWQEKLDHTFSFVKQLCATSKNPQLTDIYERLKVQRNYRAFPFLDIPDFDAYRAFRISNDDYSAHIERAVYAFREAGSSNPDEAADRDR